jgi:dihydrofolate synthase/folylpolyglutamate synthase
VYTSPHLESVAERLAVCDDDISESEFGTEYERLLPYLHEVDRGGIRVTYFETLTALAYLWFADKPVDAAVFEVGMGGTWDATNLVRPQVAVFCEIDLDHPELGSTVEEVAREKAGIVKDGSTVVISDPIPAALAAVEERAIELGAPTLVRGHDWWLRDEELAVGGRRMTVATKNAEYEDLFIPLQGYQVQNAATAIVACEAFLGRPLSDDPLREALAGATAPGRLEVLSRRPLVIADGAHNPAGARAIATSLKEAFDRDRVLLVLACSANKDIAGIVQALASLEPELVFAGRNSSSRSAPAERVVEACAAAGLEVKSCSSVEEALEAARGVAGESDLILVTGSLYTVADARRAIVT